MPPSVELNGTGLDKSDHAAIFLTSEYKQRLVQEPPVERVVTHWSSHSEAMLQAALDDIDWDMFRESSSDVRKFTDVKLSCQHANQASY